MLRLLIAKLSEWLRELRGIYGWSQKKGFPEGGDRKCKGPGVGVGLDSQPYSQRDSQTKSGTGNGRGQGYTNGGCWATRSDFIAHGRGHSDLF